MEMEMRIWCDVEVYNCIYIHIILKDFVFLAVKDNETLTFFFHASHFTVYRML